MTSQRVPMLLTVVAANAVTAWLLVTGRLSMFELLLLISLEILALQLVSGLSQLLRKRRRHKRLAAGLAGLALRTVAVAGLVVLLWPFQLMQGLLFGVPAEHWARLLDPIGMLASSAVKWPLLVTVAGAVWDAASGRHDQTDRQLAARLMSIVLGAFPFIAPLLVAGGVVVNNLVRAPRTEGGSRLPLRVIAPAVVAVILIVGGMNALPWLFALGELGWMASFLSTKALLELTAVALHSRAPNPRRKRRRVGGTSQSRAARPGTDEPGTSPQR